MNREDRDSVPAPRTEFLHDLKIGVRQLARRPGFTIAALASLALGIGLTTTLFTLLAPLGLNTQERHLTLRRCVCRSVLESATSVQPVEAAA